MTSQQRNQQMNYEVLMNDALRTMNLVCEGSLQEKINVFLSYARSLSLKKLVDRSSTMKEKVELVSNFSSLYDLCVDIDFIKESGFIGECIRGLMMRDLGYPNPMSTFINKVVDLDIKDNVKYANFNSDNLIKLLDNKDDKK